MPVPLYLCLHVRDFAAQTLVLLRPELRKRPVVILDGDPPLETVFALNERARHLGLALGMSRLQAESFDNIFMSSRAKQQEDSAFLVLMNFGERISPRIEVLASPQDSSSGATFILDISASERLFGTPEQIAMALGRNMDAAGFEACIATSGNAYAAVLAARGFHGTTIIPPGEEATKLASLPITVLELEPEQQETFTSWGIKTLGALATLPQKALIARIGQTGYRLQALSRGEYQHLLVPAEPPTDAILSESTELEPPVDLLEPLLFLLGRMLEQIIARASERALAIAYVETRLVLAANDAYIAIRPDDPNPLDTRGDILYMAGRDDEAVAAYRKLLQLKPDFSYYSEYLKLAIVYTDQKKPDMAKAAFQQFTQRTTPLLRLYVPGFEAQFKQTRGDFRRRTGKLS
jgi:protein ImuB